MAVKRAIPLPTRDEVADFLPSEQFPSDHLSVCIPQKFRRNASGKDTVVAS